MAELALLQDIFDYRLKESLYSGLDPEEDGVEPRNLMQDLVEDYGTRRKPPTQTSTTEAIEDLPRHGRIGFARTDIDPLADQFLSVSMDDLVVPFSRRRSPAIRAADVRIFSPIVEWEGYVESIDDNHFYGKLIDIRSNNELPQDEARFSKNELSDFQLQNLNVGAVFRWVVGLERLPSGQRRRVSEVYFRRLPAHSNRELKTTLERARAFTEAINWDESS
ncbi:MAG: hypothetical protein GY768_19495 [Planctomycetaceae bacterium]|nr:hypothetical protein [Planctomycetaceae bacterium]